MNGNAMILANLILAYRAQAFASLPVANTTLTGVAQWHANDMAANNYVGLVGSDGEDAFNRLVNSGGTASAYTGIVAVGPTTDPNAAFAALQANFSSNAVLLYNATWLSPDLCCPGNTTGWTQIGVGYNNGYWMVIMNNPNVP